MKSETLFWPTIVALAVALTAVRSSGPPEPTAAEAEAPRAAPSATRADKKWSLARTAPLESKLEGIEQQLVAATGGEGEGRKPRYLVALVPDPAYTELKYFFDRQIEAVQRAIETFGYVSLREDVGALSTDGGAGEAPLGILAYVAKPTEPPLLVLLVGESPVAGPDPSALTRTLSAVAARARANGAHDVAILGPTFSGSRRAIRVAMDRVLAMETGPSERDVTPTRFTVVSGSATAFANKTDLEGPKAEGSRLRFAATVHPDSALLAALYEFLGASESNDHLKLAILSESNSGYGQSIKDATDRDSAGQPKLMNIPFPMHVSSLRQARVKGKNGRAGGVDLRDVAADFRSSLRISLDDPGGRRHGIPVQDQHLSPVAIELMLDEIANTLVGARVTHAVIFATDIRDKLFLADEIRAHCPNVRLVTFEADALFLHPDVETTLDGMLVVSTYPLNGWVSLHGSADGPDRMVPFASNGSQGTFNAALHLLDFVRSGGDDFGAPIVDPRRGEWAFDVGGVPARVPEVLATGESPAAPFVEPPPIWISAVANGRFWPLDAIHVREIASKPPASNDDVAAYTVRFRVAEDAARRKPEPPAMPPAPFLLLGAAVTLACVIAGCRNARIFGRAASIEPAPWVRYRLFELVATAIPFVYIAAVALPPGSAAWGGTPFNLVRALLSLALSVVTVGLVFSMARVSWAFRSRFDPVSPTAPPRSARRAWLAGRWTAVAAVVAMAFLLLFFCPFERHILSPSTWCDAEPFLRERATILLSGVSPVWPLVLVFGGLWWWSVASQGRFRRLRLLEGGLAIEHAGTRWSERIRRSREELLRSVWSFRPSRLDVTAIAVLPGLATLAAAFILTFRSGGGATFESPTYEWTLRLGGAAFCVAAFLAGQHALQIAKALRNFTGSLAHHPVEDAFSKLPDDVAKGIGRQFWGRVPSGDDLKDWVQRISDLCKEGIALASNSSANAPAIGIAKERLVRTRRRFERELAESVPADADYGARLARGAAPSCSYQAAVRAARRLDCVAERLSTSDDATTRKWAEDVRVALALQVLLWVRTVYGLVRTLLALVSVIAVMGLLASVSYPFALRSLYGLLAWGVIGSGIAAFAIVYVSVSRDATLSRIARTTPDKATVDWSLVQATVLFVLVPLAALLAIQFPDAREWLSAVAGLAKTLR